MKKHVLTSLLLGTVLSTAYSQKMEWNTPGAGNPFIPGYFADPTIKKFGDTYYVYATTDGSGAGFVLRRYGVARILRTGPSCR